jgi:hypothetical protein
MTLYRVRRPLPVFLALLAALALVSLVRRLCQPWICIERGKR